LETRHVVTASSASRSPDAAAPASAGGQPASQPAADVTAITTSDEFLLELGQALAGAAAVRPVDSLEASLESLSKGKRAQVLVIDAREVANIRAAVDAAHAAQPRVVVLVFAENVGDKQLSASLKGSKVFALLPTAIDARKTQAVLEGAITAAISNKAAGASAASAAGAAPQASLTIGAFRPEVEPAHAGDGGRRKLPLLIIAGVVAAALAGGGAYWYVSSSKTSPAPHVASAASPAAAPVVEQPPSADTSIVHGKVDELLEKARLAMHERRFTEPTGDNALLYYRSAVAADGANGEARDGLQRVAAVLSSRFEEAMTAGRFDEAAQTLANLKAATPADERVAGFEQHLYAAEIAKAIADGNLDRASAYLRQAQQSPAVPADQVAKWRADIARRQEDVKVQRLSGLVEDRIRDGRLMEADDSAKSYLQELQTAAPANVNTPRVARELGNALLRKAREAGLAKNNTEEERWLTEARAVGMKPGDILAFQKELAGARQKSAQADGERAIQAARDRLRDGRLTDPAQDSAAYYLAQVQSNDPSNAALPEASHELAGKLLERARSAVMAGKSADTDLAQARRWGADPKDVLAVQQLNAPKAGAATDPASLAANLKRTRSAPPDYPSAALLQHLAGSVTLEFTVDTHGETRDIHVVEATPPGVFDQAAINAVKHWRYAPMLVDGAAVEVPVRARMRFELPK
jgi:TonB family protein